MRPREKAAQEDRYSGKKTSHYEGFGYHNSPSKNTLFEFNWTLDKNTLFPDAQ